MSKLCTEENFQKLQQAISSHEGKKGSLMPILNDVQRIYGCVPRKIQLYLSEKLGIPFAEIFGVVTFYSQFSIEPKGDHIIGVCLGTACYVKEAQQIIDEVKSKIAGLDVGKTTPDGKFTLEATRCIGACGLAPVMTINEETYGNLTRSQVEGILAKY